MSTVASSSSAPIGWSPVPSDIAQECPHCGKVTQPYNGRVVSPVCHTVWRQVPQCYRAALALPGVAEDQRRAAWQHTIEVALAMAPLHLRPSPPSPLSPTSHL